MNVLCNKRLSLHIVPEREGVREAWPVPQNPSSGNSVCVSNGKGLAPAYLRCLALDTGFS